MKRMLFAAALAGMALLGGCALLPDNATTADAKQAVQVALTTYADVYQPAVIAYGKLPACPNPTPSGSICHSVALYAKLAAADAAVTKSIVAAQAVLEGTATDTGQLLNALTAIQNAEVSIASSGALTGKP